jgi:SOS response regulatory protein OraA/RecX
MSEKSARSDKGQKKLGETLLETGLIDDETLAKALRTQEVKKKKLGRILIDMGVADDEEIAKALAKQLDVPFVRLDEVEAAQSRYPPLQLRKTHDMHSKFHITSSTSRPLRATYHLARWA